MRGVTALFAIAGFLSGLAAAFFIRGALTMNIAEEAGGMLVANASLMHQQAMSLNIGLAAAVVTAILWGSAGICAVIERD